MRVKHQRPQQTNNYSRRSCDKAKIPKGMVNWISYREKELQKAGVVK